MHFSIVKISPPDAPPAHGLDDAILPLFHALRRLGYQTEILLNRANPASRNIVFGSCMSPRSTGRMLPPGSIIFNLEQITRESKWCNDNYLAHLKDYQVWDYSLANQRDLRETDIEAVHVPIGYVPEMSRLNKNFPPVNDLLFYGLITERRRLILDSLLKGGLKLLATQEAFGDLRDRLLAGSRLVLNLHNYSRARLEVVRLGYVWANRKPVLSERGPDTEVPEHLEEACRFAAKDELGMAAAALLTNGDILEKQADAGFKAFSSRPMEESLAKVIGKRGFKSGAPVHESDDMRNDKEAAQNRNAGDKPSAAYAGARTEHFGGNEAEPESTGQPDHPAYLCRNEPEWLINDDISPENS